MKNILTLISLAILLASASVSAHDDIAEERFAESLNQNLEILKVAQVGDSWTTTEIYKGNCPYTETIESQVIKVAYRGVYILEKTTRVAPIECPRENYQEEQIVYRDTSILMDFLSGKSKEVYAVTQLGNDKFLFTTSFVNSTIDVSVPFYRMKIDQVFPDSHRFIEPHGIKAVDLKDEDIEICSLIPMGGIDDGSSYLCALKNPFDFLDLERT